MDIYKRQKTFMQCIYKVERKISNFTVDRAGMAE